MIGGQTSAAELEFVDGAGDGVSDEGAQTTATAFIVRVNPIREQDDRRLRIEVHNHRSAGVAGVAECAGAAEEVAAQACGVTAYVPAESAAHCRIVLRRNCRHSLDGHRAEDAAAVNRTAVHNGSSDDREILGAREDTRIAGISAVDNPRHRVVNLSDERQAVFLTSVGAQSSSVSP